MKEACLEILFLQQSAYFKIFYNFAQERLYPQRTKLDFLAFFFIVRYDQFLTLPDYRGCLYEEFIRIHSRNNVPLYAILNHSASP